MSQRIYSVGIQLIFKTANIKHDKHLLSILLQLDNNY